MKLLRFLVINMVLVLLNVNGSETAATAASYIALQNDPILKAYVHPYRLKQGHESETTMEGAIGINALFDRGSVAARYIEEQRRGTDFFISPGVALNDPVAVRFGIKSLDYAFRWETDQGTFPGNPDAFHSATFFLEGAAQGVLLLRGAHMTEYSAENPVWKSKITALTRWLMRAENRESPKALADLKLFSHRHYSYAAALAEAAQILDLPEAAEIAAAEVDRGLRVQLPDGTNPERGGFDAGYQTAGLQFATRYWFFCKDPMLRARVAKMIEKGTDLMVSKLDADGRVSVEGSTRIGKEKTREGVTKSFNHAVLVNVLVHAAAITGRSDYRDVAERVGRLQVAPEL